MHQTLKHLKAVRAVFSARINLRVFLIILTVSWWPLRWRLVFTVRYELPF
jgi:hypothetical protein